MFRNPIGRRYRERPRPHGSGPALYPCVCRSTGMANQPALRRLPVSASSGADVWSVLRESNTRCRLGRPLLPTEKNANKRAADREPLIHSGETRISAGRRSSESKKPALGGFFRASQAEAWLTLLLYRRRDTAVSGFGSDGRHNTPLRIPGDRLINAGHSPHLARRRHPQPLPDPASSARSSGPHGGMAGRSRSRARCLAART